MTLVYRDTHKGAALGYADAVFVAAPVVPSGATRSSGLAYRDTHVGGALAYANTLAYSVAPVGSSGGGGGPVREVKAFAKLLDAKPSKSVKKARKKAIVAEALQLLPDVPEAAEIAPVIAQLVYAQTAPAFANWSPARAMEPLPPAAYAAMRAKVDAFLQQIALQEDIDDEHVIELLLLG